MALIAQGFVVLESTELEIPGAGILSGGVLGQSRRPAVRDHARYFER